MNRKQKALAIAVVILLISIKLGWSVPVWIGLEGTARIWILRGGLWLLGLVAGLLVFFGLRNRPEPAAGGQQRTEIDVAMAAARARLAGARGKSGAQFGKHSLLLVLGPTGAAKTTVVTRSGLEPDLLAGEIMRGDAVTPTSCVNVWYAQGHLIVEAGGRLGADAGQWRKLIRYIQPQRLSAVLSRGKQAPRLAVVCIGCDELLKPGASESVPGHAQRLRAHLAEISHHLGIRLPVYVIFTKTDRLPYFEDFVRSFTREEARDVLGATLTVPPAGNVGHYADRESRRIAYAFQSVFQGLALRRIDVLPRETQDAVKSGTYEFPREFRKVVDLASLFLLELCRPSQLGVSPFLRGFYFTGVRPVLVHDVAAPPPVQMRAPAGGGAVDATAVFDPRALYHQAAQPVAQTGARKVPEWVFLDRIFRDVILRDTVAQALTGGGTKVTLGRRIVLGAAAAALVFFSLGMTWSVFANRSLLRDAGRAVEGARSLALEGALPAVDALQRLDALRVQAERLNRYQRAGHPMHLSWGVYAGDRVQTDVRNLYFRKFDELLWSTARTRLNTFLATLPETPRENSNYDSTYDALKAYLVTSERPDSARRDFLAPALTRIWLQGGEIDAERAQLAAAQFGFFADELPIDNPFQHQADGGLVTRTRAFLQAFAGEHQLYSYLLAIARESLPPIRWQDATVLNDFEVRPEFTRTGWQRAQEALNDLPRLLNRETWVVGESAVPEVDRIRMERALRQKYTDDYATTWTQYLQAGRLANVSGVRDVSARLRALANNPSPLIRMIGLASEHTAVDTAIMNKVFAAAHTVAAPNTTAPTEAGGKYVQALAGLQAQLEQVANETGSMQEQMRGQALGGAQLAKGVVNELVVGFSTQGQAQMVGSAVGRLLLAPITTAEAALGRVSIEALNGLRRALCEPLVRLGGRYPFNRNGAEAAPGDVKEQLAPGSGTVWAFYEQNLQNVLVRSGTRFNSRPGASPEATPQFREYFNILAGISDALFDEQGDYQLLFTLRMETSAAVPSITVTAMGSSATFTPNDPRSRTFAWDGTPLQARIVATMADRQQHVYEEIPPGPWALFRLLERAQVEPRGADTYRVTWRRGPVPISGELKLNEPSSIFHPGLLGRVGSCPPTIAR